MLASSAWLVNVVDAAAAVEAAADAVVGAAAAVAAADRCARLVLVSELALPWQ